MAHKKKQLQVSHPIILLLILAAMMKEARGVEKVFQHSCNEISGDANGVRVVIRILPRDDPIFNVYGFDAEQSDTSLSTNRIDACMYDTTGIVDPDTDAIEMTIDIDTTSASNPCGAFITDETTYNRVSLLFRVYAYSDTMLSGDDDSWSVECRDDNLDGVIVMSEEAEVAATSVITSMAAQTDAFLRVRDETSLEPVTLVNVGDRVIISVEFSPVLERGPDAYGTHFFVGFLGNDPISEASASELRITIYPRYAIRTDITVTTADSTETYTIMDGVAMNLVIPSDFMGCAGDGEAIVDATGIEINSYDMEIGVFMCNFESDSSDCYTALPIDVTGTEYYTVSMPTVNGASEIMVIGQEDATTVDIDVPAGITHSVLYDGVTYTGGETLSVTLNKRETLCVSQALAVEDNAHMAGYHITSSAGVSVLSGNRKLDTDHAVDQMPPVSTWGKSFVLIPADPVDDGRVTKYIVQALTDGTTVTRYTASAPEVYNIDATNIENPPLILDVASREPCELEADQPIMVTMVVSEPTGSDAFDRAMVVMPAIRQFAPKYRFTADIAQQLVFVKKVGTGIQLAAGSGITLNNAFAVLGPGGYEYDWGLTVNSLTQTFVSDDNSNFLMVMMMYQATAAGNDGIVILPWGIRYAGLDDCYPVGHRGDLRDNDCDGLIDEEIIDQIDNDGDGLIDEDVIAETAEIVGAIAIRPVSCKVSGDISFATSVDLTDSDGCVISGSTTGPFKPSTDFTPQTGSNIGTGVLHKIMYSASFEVAMFIDSPKLYFSCDIDKYCSIETDTACTTDICNVARKRRDVDDSQKNITSDVWIFPYQSDSATSNSTVVVRKEAGIAPCLDNSSVKAMFICLLLVSLICFMTSCWFCFMFRRKQNKDKDRKRRTSHLSPSSGYVDSFSHKPY